MNLFKKKQGHIHADRPVPRHVAIIMDGNGRWAKKRSLPRTAGHAAGSETFRQIALYCRDIGMDYLTVYAFSTENWKRSEQEVTAIMGLLKKYLLEAIEKIIKDQMRLHFFGDLTRIDPELQKLVEQTDALSAELGEDTIQVNVCLNYGGRDEIVRGAREFARRCAAGEASPEDLTEEGFSDLLYSAGIPDPELVIRTGGESRISNYLLWQSAYAEYYFTDVMWPDFTPRELEKAIADYNGRNRRFGGAKP